jgi:hypothetical protein
MSMRTSRARSMGGADDDRRGTGCCRSRDRVFHVLHLLRTISHRGQSTLDVRVAGKCFGNLADCVRAWIHQLGPAATGRQDRRAHPHPAVRKRRPVFDGDHVATYYGWISNVDRRLCLEDLGIRIDRSHIGLHLVHVVRYSRVHLVDDDDVGHPHVRLAGIKREFMAGPVRVYHRDQQVGTQERCVVVAAIPDHYIGFLLGGAQDLGVLDTGPYHRAGRYVRLVLFALLERDVVQFEVSSAGEALHTLRGQIAIRHRVA